MNLTPRQVDNYLLRLPERAALSAGPDIASEGHNAMIEDDELPDF